MKKIVIIALVLVSLVVASNRLEAQTKIGYISLTELYPHMAEWKKADTSMIDYQNALSQNYDDMQKEFREQDSLLTSKDTVKFTKAQLEIKKGKLNEMYIKLTGWREQAQQMLQQKQQELMAPVQKKALDAIQAVAKENGFTYVINRENLFVYPPSEDLLPLVKKKLGIK